MVGMFVLLAFGTLINEFMIFDFVGYDPPTSASWVWITPLVIAAGTVVAWYSTRTPTPPTASWYQPVWLAAEDDDSITFGFEHAGYAQAFRVANGLPR
jgi:hypothetical protein